MAEIKDYETINAAITQEIECPIVTKWIILGEGLDDEGDKISFHITSEGCTRWDELGLMAYHTQYRQAQHTGESRD